MLESNGICEHMMLRTEAKAERFGRCGMGDGLDWKRKNCGGGGNHDNGVFVCEKDQDTVYIQLWGSTRLRHDCPRVFLSMCWQHCLRRLSQKSPQFCSHFVASIAQMFMCSFS